MRPTPMTDTQQKAEAMEHGELTAAIYDRTGREIMQGDVLKVFHFTGRRNKQHYMYKQVVREVLLGKSRNPYWFLSHLDQREDDGYHLAKDGTHYPGYEIVQSVDACFEDRPRLLHALRTQDQGDSQHG